MTSIVFNPYSVHTATVALIHSKRHLRFQLFQTCCGAFMQLSLVFDATILVFGIYDWEQSLRTWLRHRTMNSFSATRYIILLQWQ
mmetsp:Transcript_2184/g.6403  ORF Transcript_2184/g.6403 Transcript_2184/m.6403 type:complete len:85 (+) Transcript_2184:27-281(+)